MQVISAGSRKCKASPSDDGSAYSINISVLTEEIDFSLFCHSQYKMPYLKLPENLYVEVLAYA